MGRKRVRDVKGILGTMIGTARTRGDVRRVDGNPGSGTRYVVTQFTKPRRKFPFGLPRSSAEGRQPSSEEMNERRRVGRGEKMARDRSSYASGIEKCRDEDSVSSVSVSSKTISEVEKALNIVDQHAMQLGLSRQQMMECLDECERNAGDDVKADDLSGSLDVYTLPTLEDLESLTTTDRNQNTVETRGEDETVGTQSVQSLVGKLEKALPMAQQKSGNASVGSRTAVEIKEFLNILDRHADYFGVTRDEMIQRLDEERAVLIKRGGENAMTAFPADDGYSQGLDPSNEKHEEDHFGWTGCRFHAMRIKSYTREYSFEGQNDKGLSVKTDDGENELDEGCQVGFGGDLPEKETVLDDNDPNDCSNLSNCYFMDCFSWGNQSAELAQGSDDVSPCSISQKQKPRSGTFASCTASGQCGCEPDKTADGPIPVESFRRKYKSRGRLQNSSAGLSDAPDEIHVNLQSTGEKLENLKSGWMEKMSNLELNKTEDSLDAYEADSVSTITGMSSADMGGRAKYFHGRGIKGGSLPTKARGRKMWRKGSIQRQK